MTNGTAVFSAAPGVTTVTGNNGFIPAAALQKVGYLIGWNMSLTLDMVTIARCGQQWKEQLPGQAGGSGSAEAYFIATETLFRILEEGVCDQKYFLLELFNYDPDQDQTGDHFLAWVTFNSFGLNAPVGDVVKENINFTIHGMISFAADA
jgi:hypothetical protein